MKSAIIFSGSGPIVIVTSHTSLDDEGLLKMLAARGMSKFIAFELPIEMVRGRYGNHFEVTCENLKETDDLRIMDIDGSRIMSLFAFDEYGPPIFREPVREAVVT
jgi:hypothetical protein